MAEEEFGVSMTMNKKELIEKYEQLLDAYKSKARAAQRAERQLSESEKRVNQEALAIADEAVSEKQPIDAITSLRATLNAHLSGLAEQLEQQAMRVTSLDRAISLKERRLSELHELDQVADGLNKLTTLYEERKTEAEAALERSLSETAQRLTAEHAALIGQTQEVKQRWEAERAEYEAKRTQEKRRQELERQREEADYLYERDKSRRLEVDEYTRTFVAKQRQHEAQLQESAQQLERQLAQAQAQQQEFEALRLRAESFPQEIAAAVDRALATQEKTLSREHEAQLNLSQKEHKWEVMMIQQRVEHLESLVAELREKVQEQKTQLDASASRVQKIAEKAVEGASMARAYQSVNDIAIEQARRPDRAGND